jgi:hypothetical protein
MEHFCCFLGRVKLQKSRKSAKNSDFSSNMLQPEKAVIENKLQDKEKHK